MPANRQGRPRMRASNGRYTVSAVDHSAGSISFILNGPGQALQSGPVIPPEPSPVTPVVPEPGPTFQCVHGILHQGVLYTSSVGSPGHRPRFEIHRRTACYACYEDVSKVSRFISDYMVAGLLAKEVEAGHTFTLAQLLEVREYFRICQGPVYDTWEPSGRREGDSLHSWCVRMLKAHKEEQELYDKNREEYHRMQRRNAEKRISSDERARRSHNAKKPRGTTTAPSDPTPEGVRRFAGIDPHCGHEGEDCDCDDLDIPRKGPDHGLPFLARKCDPVKRLVGLEVETNTNVSLATWLLKWRGSVHQDGSCGWEAVTTPLGGIRIQECMTDLAKAMAAEEAEADDRCGVHVHVDARDVRWHDMYRILAVYAHLEPVLYLIAGQHRLTQHYCMPCGDKFRTALGMADPKDAVMYTALQSSHNAGAGRSLARGRPDKKDGGRYKGINIVPWITGRRTGNPDTTIEFRMHRNSLDGARLAGWASLLAEIVEWCVNASDAEVKALPRSALRALCTVIAPHSAAWVLKRVGEWRKVTAGGRSDRYSPSGKKRAFRRIKIKGGVYQCAA